MNQPQKNIVKAYQCAQLLCEFIQALVSGCGVAEHIVYLDQLSQARKIRDVLHRLADEVKK